MMILTVLKRAILSRLILNKVHTPSAPQKYGNSYALSGCGWLIPFYFGVVNSMKARGVMNNTSTFAGTSAGSLAALVACCNVDCQQVMIAMVKLAKDKEFQSDRTIGLKKILNKVLPSNALELCQGRLHVTMTKVWPSPENDAVIVSKFSSIDHLIDVVAASCYIPFYSSPKLATQIGKHPELYIDGGVFAFMPPIGDVTISPFPQRFIYEILPIKPDPKTYRPACIFLSKTDYPLHKLLSWVLIPPEEEDMWALYHKGEDAAGKWMDSHLPPPAQ